MKRIKVGYDSREQRPASESDMKMIIVLSGIHSSGKSTLGRSLGEQGYAYVLEIVERFIEQGITTGVKAEPTLDEMIMEAEFQRDKYLFRSARDPIIVETWHPGNIAYATLRNPIVATRYKKRFGPIAKHHRIYGIYLRIGDHTFLERTRKYIGQDALQAIEFFHNLEQTTLACYRDFQLPLIEIDAVASIAVVQRKVLSLIENIRRDGIE